MKWQVLFCSLLSLLISISTAYAQTPTAATLISPTGVLGSDSPTYTWNAVPDTSWYFLWVDDSSGNVIRQWYRSTDVGCVTANDTCSVTPHISLSEGAGRWWIQTWNTDGYGLWSDAMSIAVGESLGKVTLTAPSGMLDTVNPTYTWDAVSGVSWYFLWVKNKQGNVLQKWYRSSEVDCESGSGTCSVAPGLELEAGADYQWWIQPWNESEGNGPWSDAMRFIASAGGGEGDYPGGEYPKSAQDIPLNQQVSLSPAYDTEWNNKPQKYGNYKFDVEKDGEITLDIQAAKVGASWIQVKEASQGTVVTETWVANDSSGTTDSFKVKAGETYTFFINKHGADIETIGLKVNFSASHFEFPWDHGKLMTDSRMLKHEDGTGFFWMGDTAWHMSIKLTEDEVRQYLDKRQEQGFNVIQMSALPSDWLMPLESNWSKARPFNNIPSGKPYYNIDYSDFNNKYWEHVDFIIDEAEKRGIYIALLPTWNNAIGQSADKTAAENMADYGKTIAARYKNRKNIIWVNGGDTLPGKDGFTSIAAWNALGNAINDTVGDNQLITFHSGSGASPSDWFSNTQWLDFNMIQSGHGGTIVDANNGFKTAYNNSSMPILDGEPRYEDILRNVFHGGLDGSQGRYDANDVREIAYIQLFSGAFGHTYGHHSVWQMYKGGDTSCCGSVTKTWDKAINDLGATQMGYVAKLMKSRPILSRIPDQSIIQSGNAVATRGDGYAFAYLPEGGSVTVNLGVISGDTVKAWWYNPRTGEATEVGSYENNGTASFNTGSDDMVLVLDDASKYSETPGS